MAPSTFPSPTPGQVNHNGEEDDTGRGRLSDSSDSETDNAEDAWKDRILVEYEKGRQMTLRKFFETLDRSGDGNADSKDQTAITWFFQDDDKLTHIEIYSKYLIEIIEKVNKHPSLNTSPKNYMTMAAPFPVLFYHLEDVRAEISKLNIPEAQADFKALELTAERSSSRWKTASSESFDSGFVRYDTIWRLFQPGELVVRKDDLNNEWLLIFVEIQERKRQRAARDRDGRPKTLQYIELVTWGLVWDGSENKIKRKAYSFRIHPFVGPRLISSLVVYPVRHRQSDQSVADFCRDMASRGRKWQSYIKKKSSCMEYNGIGFMFETNQGPPGAPQTTRKVKIEGRVILDTQANQELEFQSPNFDNAAQKDSRGRLYVSLFDSRKEYQWDSIPVIAKLTEEQASLCPPIVGCYAVLTKKFCVAIVDELKEVEWNMDAMKHLVLDEEKKRMLQGLVGQHYGRKQSSGGDLIAGKGEGLVILLHGPPGVGKTLTAESLAETVKRPLLALSIGDLVWDETKLQQRLEAEFRRAMNWDAILLLDEADVVLEARSLEDVRRNGIVSVFLRQLEYFQGVLFLTTNRISTMDLAFQSRIQVGITFKDLTPEIRKEIWTKLLDLNYRNESIDSRALKEVKDGLGRLAQIELNGRQIRNVLNVANGYAFNDFGRPGGMDYKHIMRAVKAAVEFQEFFDEERSNAKAEQSVWAPYRGSESGF